MSNFSSSLLLADLDYIAPSQACIKPTTTTTRTGEVHVHRPGEALPDAIKITLQDCLACSGCVTTAETMLVTSQSREEIEQQVAANGRRVCVSISDQSAASIAVALGCSAAEAFGRISGFVRRFMKASVVIDLRWAQKISCDETAAEYVWRLQHAPHLLPMLVSSCPGWVCYCEKTHPQLLPLLSPVMSAQGIGGSYLKHVMPDAYHVSIQPCFDRKLEAVREDFATDGEGRMIDCVLSSLELLSWMQDAGLDPQLVGGLDTTPCALRGPLGADAGCEAAGLQGSGSYHQHCLAAAQRHFGGAAASAPMRWSSLQYATKRNANHRVVTLPQCPAVGEACIAYGFQHIQNIVRCLNRKMATVKHHTLIEVMACPEGCLNGGGQVRGPNAAEQRERVEEAHASFEEQCALQPSSDAPPPPFSAHAVAASEWGTRDSARGFLLRCRANFHDRKADMEKVDAIAHSLKW